MEIDRVHGIWVKMFHIDTIWYSFHAIPPDQLDWDYETYSLLKNHLHPWSNRVFQTLKN
ncbi:hypothetical protein D3C87_1257400 [compost metagenome]